MYPGNPVAESTLLNTKSNLRKPFQILPTAEFSFVHCKRKGIFIHPDAMFTNAVLNRYTQCSWISKSY